MYIIGKEEWINEVKAYMDSYTSFAMVYDTFMDNIPYESWSRYVIDILKQYGIEDGLVLDMGCGTGNMTELLCQAGYDMIGIDNSEDMLGIAMEKAADQAQDILYLLQDMREFELYGTVRAIVSICDSMNYILEEEDLLDVFRLVNNYLDPGGIFIFDMNTIYKYENVLGNQTIAENREDCSFIWDNYYYEDEQVNEYELSIFVKDHQRSKDNYSEGEPFMRFTETHYQRAYDLQTVKALLEAAGLEFVTAYDAFTYDCPKENSERIYIIAKEHGKMIDGGMEDE